MTLAFATHRIACIILDVIWTCFCFDASRVAPRMWAFSTFSDLLFRCFPPDPICTHDADRLSPISTFYIYLSSSRTASSSRLLIHISSTLDICFRLSSLLLYDPTDIIHYRLPRAPPQPPTHGTLPSVSTQSREARVRNIMPEDPCQTGRSAPCDMIPMFILVVVGVDVVVVCGEKEQQKILRIALSEPCFRLHVTRAAGVAVLPCVQCFHFCKLSSFQMVEFITDTVAGTNRVYSCAVQAADEVIEEPRRQKAMAPSDTVAPEGPQAKLCLLTLVRLVES